MSGTGADIIRTDWSFELAAVTQRFALNVVVPEPEALIRAVHDLADSVPAAASQAEQLVLHDRLRIAIDNASHQFHAQFHRYIAPRCDHGWRATSGPMSWSDVNVTAEQLLLNWVTGYLASFERSHEWPAPVRAARLIRSTFRYTCDIDHLARGVGCSRTQLIRSFKEAYGLSVGGYQTRCRIRSAVALLRRPGSNVGAVAFEVGYHSAKNFYRALRGLTGLTPSEIRQLPESEAATMLATLDLPAPALLRPSARISA